MNKFSLKNFEVINGYAVFHDKMDDKIYATICRLDLGSAAILIDRNTTDVTDGLGGTLYQWVSSTTAELKLNIKEMKDSGFVRVIEFKNIDEFNGFKKALEVIG